MHTTTISKKGQVVIPAALRKKLGLTEGTKLVVTEAGDGLRLRPLDESYYDQYAGVLSGEGAASNALLKERKKERDREDSRSR